MSLTSLSSKSCTTLLGLKQQRKINPLGPRRFDSRQVKARYFQCVAFDDVSDTRGMSTTELTIGSLLFRSRLPAEVLNMQTMRTTTRFDLEQVVRADADPRVGRALPMLNIRAVASQLN